MTTPDFRVTDHGSICLLTPLTPAAEDWVASCLPSERQTFGRAIVIEPRYVDAIVHGFMEDNLTVESH